MTDVEQAPKDAPENCPGPGSKTAGESDACQGCPSRDMCKSTPKVDPGKFPLAVFKL